MKVYSAVRSPVEGVPLFIPGAGGIDPETDVMPSRSAARVDIAIEAVDRELVPAIYLSGGVTGSTNVSEAEDMYGYLQAGVSLKAIMPPVYLETRADRSMKNWALSMALFDQTGLLKDGFELGVVTDESHMRRFLYIAQFVLPEQAKITPIFSRYKPTVYESAREVVALKATKRLLRELPVGVGAAAVLVKESQYAQRKSRVNSMLHRTA